MKPILFGLPGNELIAEKINSGLNAEKGNIIIHQFPDGETYLRVLSDINHKAVFIVCSLHQPNSQLLPLLFLCNLLKDLKAKSIFLIAPYLSYMRQDIQFNPGEAVTSAYFARLLSSHVDRIITIDPHLHRIRSLEEIYSVPCEVIHTAGIISEWIQKNVNKALLIGPDNESEQWISEVAKNAGVPFIVLQKIRHGDADVEISVPQLEKFKDHTPVLLDDIISTAQTMIETVKCLRNSGMKPPVCIGIHAVFANDSYKNMVLAGVKDIITCNTIEHESNRIDVSELIINSIINQ